MTECYEIVCEDTSRITRAEWLLHRKRGLGSSDAAAAMSMSPWQSAYSLWAEKSGLTPELDDTERFLWGRLLEDIILDQAEARGWLGEDVVGGRKLMLRHRDMPWMLANPDHLTPSVVVEAKTADGWVRSKWDAGVPDHYVLQGMWAMVVTGRPRCVFPVLFGGNDLQRYVVEYDAAVAEPMIAAGEVMWERICSNRPPDADGSEASMLALRQVFTEQITGKAVELPLSMEASIEDRRLWAQRVKDAEAEIDTTKAAVMQAMGDAELALMAGYPVATWTTNKAGNRAFRWSAPEKEKR